MLVACQATEAPPPEEPTREQAVALAEARPPPAEAPPAPPPGSPAIRVELHFDGIAPLHQSFFSDAEAVARLGRSLHGRHSDPVPLEISFDSDNHIGVIRLRIDPGSLQVPIQRTGDTIRLSDLAPITVPIAAYRSELASRLDFRIQSFHIQLLSVRGLSACTIELAGEPPDGRSFSPCVTVGGREHCGTATDAGFTFTPDVTAELARCLDL